MRTGTSCMLDKDPDPEDASLLQMISFPTVSNRVGLRPAV
jgi:hypothetical protein